ncbi:MAG: TIGR03987 family protein [Coriobacteriia bacterium]|nr:TIGR03987 family protein [Coriobacteriia bacterium]
MLIAAMITILVAAAVYTVAVFAERRAGVLKTWHLVLFWLGFVFDTTGTTLMAQLAGGWKWDFHGVTGASAIALMLLHSTWATIALLMRRERVLHQFHRFSVVVWVLWMIALLSGFAMVGYRMATRG